MDAQIVSSGEVFTLSGKLWQRPSNSARLQQLDSLPFDDFCIGYYDFPGDVHGIDWKQTYKVDGEGRILAFMRGDGRDDGNVDYASAVLVEARVHIVVGSEEESEDEELHEQTRRRWEYLNLNLESRSLVRLPAHLYFPRVHDASYFVWPPKEMLQSFRSWPPVSYFKRREHVSSTV